jgi:prepilin-type N-terminal cleavage/methylation domain-containing protein
MKVNQKGFSVVEILIVIVVAGLIGTVGWLVYDRQKNKTDDKSVAQTTQQEQKQETPTDTQPKNAEAVSKKSFSAYGVKLLVEELDGWDYQGIYGYPGEDSNEYQINISNKGKDIQLSLQISTFETSLYKQSIVDSFTGFNGKKYYITGPLDDQPGDSRYQQMRISACDNGHCVTALNDTYNLNANITPIGSNKDFNGSKENLEQVKKLFSSIVIE